VVVATYNAKTAPDPVLSKEGYFFPVIQYKTGKGYVVYPQDVKERDFVAQK
jgi:branched-chain amino acid transport system substrate-binding protein